MSKSRLMSSYGSMAVILGLAGWIVLASLPLTGQAEVRYVPAAQNRPGYVVNRAPLFYPADALQRRVEGQVVVELSFNAKGEVVDSRVLSGREELRLAGMQTALQGKYEIDSERTLQVIVDFKLPAAGQRGAVPTPVGQPPVTRSGGGRQAAAAPRPSLTITPDSPVVPVSGNVVNRTPGARLAAMPGVRITAINSANGASAIALTDADGEYQFSGLQPGSYTLSADFPSFRTMSVNSVRGSDGMQVRFNFSLEPEALPSPQASQGLPFPVANAGATPQRVRVGANVAAANLVKQVKPEYPPDAKAAGVSGTVILEVNINTGGKIEGLRTISGDPALANAAMEAVRQWEYKPIMLNNQPVDVFTTVQVTFQ